MSRPLIFLVSIVFLFQSGCGIVALLGTPTEEEKKIPAEYDLTQNKDQRILVLVNQPIWLNTDMNLRYYLTEAIHKNLATQVMIKPEKFVSYDKLSEYRSVQANSSLSPIEAGKALDANIVFSIRIEDYQLSKMAEPGYYSGLLVAEVILLDVASGKHLWPKSSQGKTVKVGFEVESKGQETAVKRLVNACSHCITRYLYNCPKNIFKTTDDWSRVDVEKWN